MVLKLEGRVAAIEKAKPAAAAAAPAKAAPAPAADDEDDDDVDLFGSESGKLLFDPVWNVYLKIIYELISGVILTSREPNIFRLLFSIKNQCCKPPEPFVGQK